MRVLSGVVLVSQSLERGSVVEEEDRSQLDDDDGSTVPPLASSSYELTAEPEL